MNRRLFMASLVVILVGLFFLTRDPADLGKGRLLEPILVVDVRSPEEFEAGHYPGAQNIPLPEFGNAVEELRQHPGTIVVYCKTGRRSQMAYTQLKEAGFTQILNGMHAEKVAKLLQ